MSAVAGALRRALVVDGSTGAAASAFSGPALTGMTLVFFDDGGSR